MSADVERVLAEELEEKRAENRRLRRALERKEKALQECYLVLRAALHPGSERRRD